MKSHQTLILLIFRCLPKHLNNLSCADDSVLIAQSEQALQNMLDTVVAASEKIGLTLNISKTETLTISKKLQALTCKIHSCGVQVKQVDKFNYLGYLITSDGKCATEIHKRTIAAKVTFKKLSPILTNRNIKMDTKYRILKAYVWSVFFCMAVNAEQSPAA